MKLKSNGIDRHCTVSLFGHSCGMSILHHFLCKAWNGLHMHVGLTARCEHVFFLPGIRARGC